MQLRRSLLVLLIIGASLATLHSVVDALQYKRERRDESIRLGMAAGLRVADALDAALFEVAERAGAYAADVTAIDTEAQLLQSIRRESEELRLILGVTVAFEPGAFQGRERYAPFFNKSRDEFQWIETSYDYTDRELETAKWYTLVVDSGEAQWSAPYYAKAAQAMVVDYGVPLLGPRGETLGVVDYTITLSDFTRIVDTLSVGESGYGFTYDQSGAILSHPNPANLLDNVFRLGDGKTREILEELRDEPQGVVAYNSTYTFKYSWFFFSELQSTGWKSVLVFAEDDLLGASDAGRRKIIHIALGIGVLLVAILAFARGMDGFTPEDLWWLVIASSAVIVGNIVVIWYLNVTTDFSRLQGDQERIVNASILKKYEDRFDETLHKLTNERYRKVPTGLFIESYELTSFEASLVGKLWMKYPKDLMDEAPPDFYLPDVSARESRGITREKIAEVEHEDHVLVTWRFRVTLEQDFSYQQFPFEQNDIRVVLLYPDFSKNILLVPDLESYVVLNPSAKPGLNANITVPSSETIASFFSFRPIEYKTTFGNDSLVQVVPALGFNLVAKRIYLNPFIANIIPIMIVALIMFIVLYVSTGKEDADVGQHAMNVIQSSAGFLFILLLAHVNERGRIQTPEIAYIELFYFSMYLLITIQAVSLAMLYSGVRWRIFEFHDNLALKLLFWPVLSSIWLGFTLLRFY